MLNSILYFLIACYGVPAEFFLYKVLRFDRNSAVAYWLLMIYIPLFIVILGIAGFLFVVFTLVK